MISSVSVYSSNRVTTVMQNKWLITEAYNHFYVLRTLAAVVLSSVLMFFMSKISLEKVERNSKKIFWVALWLTILVLVLWVSFNWAKWWIKVPLIPFTIQPTEFLKLAMIIFFAWFLKNNQKNVADAKKWFLPFIRLLVGLVFIIWLQPDFWTILIITPILTIMYFLAWWNFKYLLWLFLIWVVFVAWVYQSWKYDKSIPTDRKTLSYITDRIDNFLSDSEDLIKNKTINYQTEQWLIAIWSGWFGWLWFGNSIQKYWYLPEVQWDFIFSVIIEELWFFGWIMLLSVYVIICYRWFIIWKYQTNMFSRYVAYWIVTRIMIQTFVNMWVNLNILPLTWLTLPFVSYWWSSLLSLMLASWLLLNISRDVDYTLNTRSSSRNWSSFSKKHLMI